MAFRYRERVAADGDVIDFRDWNANHAALAAEFNGRMDRDNLPPNAVGANHIIRGACTSTSSDVLAAPVVVSNDTIQWQAIQTLTVNAPVDALIESEWGGYWLWSGLSSGDSAAFRIIVNGVEVALLPRASMSSRPDPAYDTGYLSGVLAIPPGDATVSVEARLYDQGFLATADISTSSGTISVQMGVLIAIVTSR